MQVRLDDEAAQVVRDYAERHDISLAQAASEIVRTAQADVDAHQALLGVATVTSARGRRFR